MFATGLIFLDFNLPNATTWFYFSFLLAVALFFKFSRFLSMRNWDIVTLFLLVPGFLFLQEAKQEERSAAKKPPLEHLQVEGPAPTFPAGVSNGAHGKKGLTPSQGDVPDASPLLWLGYLWILCGTALLLFRCLLDLVLVQRPALAPNLNFGGLAWLAGALFICLMAVAYRPQVPPGMPVATTHPTVDGQVGRESMPFNLAQRPFVKSSFAMACHLLVVLGLIVVGIVHFQDAAAGMAAATFYLMLPYTGMYVGQAHHVWPMALVIWALAAYRLPLLVGFLLGAAAATAYFTAFLLPIWAGFYWGRGLGRFLLGVILTATVCLVVTGIILALTDDLGQRLREALALSDWQPWKVPTSEGFWTGIHWAYRIPVFVAYMAFVLATALWPTPKNLAHVIALSAAVLIGIQFWFADQGGVYVLWYLPLLLLLVFRPNLSEARPAVIHPETDWLTRLNRALRGGLARVFKNPETVRT